MVRRVVILRAPARPLVVHHVRALAAGVFAADDRAARYAAAFAAAIVALAGVHYAAALTIWIDEAFTLHSTGAGPAYALAQARMFEGQPPLYFVIEALWRRFDEGSIAFARLPSVLAAAAGVYLMVRAAHQIVPRVPPAVVAVVAAANPIVLWAAVEMRVYALVLLIGAGLMWAFFAGFVVETPSRRARAWYALAALAGLYTQYYVGFVLVAHGLTLLALRPRQLRAFLLTAGAIGVAFVPAIPAALQHVANSGAFVTHANFSHSLHAVFDATFVFMLPHGAQWTGAGKIAGFAAAAVLVLLLAALGRPVIAGAQRVLVTQWLVALGVFAAMFAHAGLPADPLRHVVVLAPPAMLVGIIVVAACARRVRIAGAIALAVFAVFAFTQLWSQYRPPLAKSGDWQRAGALLQADRSGAPVVVFPAELVLALSRYLPRPAIPLPRPMPFTNDYVAATTLASPADVGAVLEPLRSHSAQVWIITNGSCPRSEADTYTYHCWYLEDYLARHYTVVRSVILRGTLARLYTRRLDGAGVRASARAGRLPEHHS